MVIDPVARSTDGESVRIAKDVLCAGASTKICLPDGPEEFARALARRGQRRPVVIGDDHALVRAVALLHKERELARVALSVVPVGAPSTVALSHSLGVPTGAVAAARTVLDGTEQRMDLLTDDSDGIVLGGLRIPYAGEGGDASGGGGRDSGRGGSEGGGRSGVRAALTRLTSPGDLLAALTGRGGRRDRTPPRRLRVEADGIVLADLDRPVERVSVVPSARAPQDGPGAAAVDGAALDSGLADVVVHWQSAEHPVRARARAVTVSGTDFRYRADAVVGGPVRTRTWTVQAGAWRLTLPRD
ncbi:hypothetical protein [Streptomyces sp. MST-110588]|uniref:hypothetical protein n=1 Tax=Streptomyces sp. MST-110588 TaxID=2833628 RepID=UPI001F5E2DCA|nr:hypothetical protein [Streptomyces sp. MST-110588]UNO41154.1 hypothetical protein KGS77_18140 [Streptomyces sp. MST-110588]